MKIPASRKKAVAAAKNISAKKIVAKKAAPTQQANAVRAQLFGHVKLIQGHNKSYYAGVHALIALRDTPGKTIAVISTEHRIQTLLEAAMLGNKLVAADVTKLAAGTNPIGTMNVEDYALTGLIVYGS